MNVPGKIVQISTITAPETVSDGIEYQVLLIALDDRGLLWAFHQNEKNTWRRIQSPPSCIGHDDEEFTEMTGLPLK